MLSEHHNLNLKLCSKHYNEIDILHLILAPQLSGGWQHNYSTKTCVANTLTSFFETSKQWTIIIFYP
jgi:hypothetical protein